MSETPYNIYSVTDPEVFGSDLALSDDIDGGDLLLSPDGDLAIDEGWNNLHRAVIRRLNTMEGYLARMVRDVESLYRVDADYGNPAFRYLSEPTRNETLMALRQGVETCLMQEDRISLLKCDIRLETTNGIQVILDIDYTERGAARPDGTQTISVLQTDNGFTVI